MEEDHVVARWGFWNGEGRRRVTGLIYHQRSAESHYFWIGADLGGLGVQLVAPLLGPLVDAKRLQNRSGTFPPAEYENTWHQRHQHHQKGGTNKLTEIDPVNLDGANHTFIYRFVEGWGVYGNT